MSAWRRNAIEYLPTCRRMIEQAHSIVAAWVELWLVFQQAHREPRNIQVIQGVYNFADWCMSSKNQDIETAAFIEFFESIPTDPLVRKELPYHIGEDDFFGMQEAFKYHLSADEYAEFVSEFLSQKATYTEEFRADAT